MLPKELSHVPGSPKASIGDSSEFSNGGFDNGRDFNPVQEFDRWMKRIDKVGPEYAYEEFKKENYLRAERFQHGETHIFGEALYEKVGIRGISICDSSFTFACYHSFFGRAISEQGLGALSVIESACIEKFGTHPSACMHGVGHGILAYFGPDKLLSALNACDTLQEKPIFGGCPSGVFMEYSLPLVDDTSTQLRPFDKIHPYEPCVSAPEKFRQSCYHEITKWWEYFIDYNEIGKLCEAIGKSDEKEACFIGVGDIATLSSGYDVTETIAKCKEMPDEVGEAFCRRGAYLFFSGIPEHQAEANLLK